MQGIPQLMCFLPYLLDSVPLAPAPPSLPISYCPCPTFPVHLLLLLCLLPCLSPAILPDPLPLPLLPFSIQSLLPCLFPLPILSAPSTSHVSLSVSSPDRLSAPPQSSFLRSPIWPTASTLSFHCLLILSGQVTIQGSQSSPYRPQKEQQL